jgi:hypothetical protein
MGFSAGLCQNSGKCHPAMTKVGLAVEERVCKYAVNPSDFQAEKDHHSKMSSAIFDLSLARSTYAELCCETKLQRSERNVQ